MAKQSAGSAIVAGAGILGVGVLALKYGPALYKKLKTSATSATQGAQQKSSGGSSSGGGGNAGGGGTVGSGGSRSAGITPDWIKNVFGLAPEPKNVDFGDNSIPFNLGTLIDSILPPDITNVDFGGDSIPFDVQTLIDSITPPDITNVDFGFNFIPTVDSIGGFDFGGGGWGITPPDVSNVDFGANLIDEYAV